MRSIVLTLLREAFSLHILIVFLLLGSIAAFVWDRLEGPRYRTLWLSSTYGLRIAYEMAGQGPPLLLLAGGPGISHHGFHPYVTPLERSYTLVYFDPRGRGASDRARDYDVSGDVDDIEALRQHLALTSLDLLGISYGAHLAVAYTVAHPQRVRKLVLVSPIVGRTAWQEHLQKLVSAPGMKGVLEGRDDEEGRARISDRGNARRILKVLMPLYGCDLEAAPMSIFRARHHIARQNFEVYEALVGEDFGKLTGDLASSPLEERLGSIAAETLIMEGACDGVIPVGHAEWLATVIPKAKRIEFTASGHSPFIEETERFLRKVAGFLGA